MVFFFQIRGREVCVMQEGMWTVPACKAGKGVKGRRRKRMRRRGRSSRRRGVREKEQGGGCKSWLFLRKKIK
jgi:hypothetical protein